LKRQLEDYDIIKIDDHSLSVDNVTVEIKKDFYLNNKESSSQTLSQFFGIVISYNIEVSFYELYC
jgi:hypothetical protein